MTRAVKHQGNQTHRHNCQKYARLHASAAQAQTTSDAGSKEQQAELYTRLCPIHKWSRVGELSLELHSEREYA
eukprot:6925-Amphidinium_carterae.1